MARDFNGDTIGGVTSIHDGPVTINAEDGGTFGDNDTILTFNTHATNPIKFKKGSVSDRLEIHLTGTVGNASCAFVEENGQLVLRLTGGESLVYCDWVPQSTGAAHKLGSETREWGEVNALLFKTGGLDITSDERSKTAIINETAGLNVLRSVPVKSYRLRREGPTGRRHIGLIAQELKTALDTNGYASSKIVEDRKIIQDENGQDFETNMGVDLYGLLCLSINAIKQLEARVIALETA
jgi:hypothetical protein